jgi:ferrochelatase
VTEQADPIAPVGVLLCNLGSPAAPTPAAVRSYLKRFLADPWVIDSPRLPWFLIRHLIVLPLRTRRVARMYRAIWSEGGSPLLRLTGNLSASLERALQDRLEFPCRVAVGMRYGWPTLDDGLRALQDSGCERLLVLPLFPHHSGTTVGSLFAAVASRLHTWPRLQEVRNVFDYSTRPAYIAALVSSVTEVWHRDGRPSRLLMSFHGLPQRYATAGDPYPRQCRATAELVAESLALDSDQWAIGYQSRFGRQEWLGPSTDQILTDWGRLGLDAADVICPGFATDCLETLEEVAVSGRHLFEAAGGGRFRYIPALNDRAEHVAALAEITEDNVRGWT